MPLNAVPETSAEPAKRTLHGPAGFLACGLFGGPATVYRYLPLEGRRTLLHRKIGKQVPIPRTSMLVAHYSVKLYFR